MTIERIAERAARALCEHCLIFSDEQKYTAEVLAKELAPMAKCLEACGVIVNKAPNVSDVHKWRWAYLVAHDALSALKKEDK